MRDVTTMIVGACFFFLSCRVTSDVKPDDPRPPPPVINTEFCDAAETHLLTLGCLEGQPTKRGIRFGDFCRDVQNAGIFIDPKCLSEVSDCSQVDACGRAK